MVIALISHCLIAKANIVEIRDDKLIKDDSDSVQDTFLKVLFAQREMCIRDRVPSPDAAGLLLP